MALMYSFVKALKNSKISIMLDQLSSAISNIGTRDVTSSSGKLKYRTLNWILFWSAIASIFWAIFLFYIGNPVAAMFPVISAFSIPLLLFSLHKNGERFHWVLNWSIFLAFFVPFSVQLLHGGFVNTGAVIVWSILAPITALILKPKKTAKSIFVVFLFFLVSVSILEVFLPSPLVELPKSIITIEFLINIISVISICYFPILHFSNEMSKARKIIKTQNRKIISSIEYAQYIQRASLSSHDELVGSLNNDFFLMYEPKDIVSGDFYWVANKNGRLIIVCADCTGHGVPGGFMTMMGINHLNNIVKEKGITDPSMILLFLHYAVRESLKYSSNGMSDGMDIGVCSIDLETNLLEFSGARNKLHYFNGELQVIPSTKVSIGEDLLDVNFNKTQIQMKKNDRFYLFSDGYIDQFGGPNNKRFGSKRLNLLLNDIKELNIKDQGNVIKQTMKEWKGSEDQIDDITFMGLVV